VRVLECLAGEVPWSFCRERLVRTVAGEVLKCLIGEVEPVRGKRLESRLPEALLTLTLRASAE
jgi:hypothetical protein